MAARIFKGDAAGRVSYSAERREALDEFERRGMKGAAFAGMAGISYPTFATWIQKRRHARGDYRMRPPSVAEVVPRSAPAMRFVEAELTVAACQVSVPDLPEKRSPASSCGAGACAPLPVDLPGGAWCWWGMSGRGCWRRGSWKPLPRQAMLRFSGPLRIFIALDPCDMRAGGDQHAVGDDRGKAAVGFKSRAFFVFANEN
ncbi:MAG: hypothetical protein V4726_24445 [Verrucomicrobiota bacterium]